jgi:type IV pilus assembly protein PilF
MRAMRMTGIERATQTGRSGARSCAAVLTLAVVALLAGCGTGPTGGSNAGPQIRTESDQTDNDRRARVRLELAEGYFSRGQYTTALDEVKQAFAAKPEMIEGYNLRGLIYAAMAEDALAEDSFRRALAINARDADTLHNYGWYLCQQQRWAAATLQFDAAIALPQYRGVSRTLLAKGVCQARAGQWLEAEGTLQRSFDADPSNPATAVNLAEVLLRREDLDRARFYARRVNAQPEQVNSQSLWLALRIERRLGNTQSVRDLGDQLLKRFPQSPEAQAFENGRFNE